MFVSISLISMVVFFVIFVKFLFVGVGSLKLFFCVVIVSVYVGEFY